MNPDLRKTIAPAPSVALAQSAPLPDEAKQSRSIRRSLLLSLVVMISLGCSQAERTDETSTSVLEPENLVLSTNVHEVDRTGDGKIDQRITVVSRGGKRILMEISQANAAGDLVLQSRTFMVGKDLPMTEADENGDGFLEMIYLFSSDRELEVFKRDQSGNVTPVEAEELKLFRKAHEKSQTTASAVGQVAIGNE
jgi:hypothetical protein